jgi:proteasome alpha subunit
VTMPFYVSPEQVMKDKADYARKAITRIRSGVVITCDAGILFIAPNPSRALRKFSEIYDRIAFAAVGRYNEFENLRKAGVRYADMTGFQYDRQDVTARGLANWYAQLLGAIFTDSNKPYEVEIVVAEVGKTEEDDQLYRITFDGSVADEHGFVVMGGQADQVASALKDRFEGGMSLERAFSVAIAALTGQANGDRSDVTAAQLEVALLDRGRPHRKFRRLTGGRLETLLAEAVTGGKKTEAIAAKKTGASASEKAGASADDKAEASADDKAGASADDKTGAGGGAGEKAAGKDKPSGGGAD